MNEKLKNYTEQPDPAVWQGIARTMAHRKAVRRASWAAVGVVAVGAAVVLALPREEERPMLAEASAPATVETMAQPATSAPLLEEPKATAPLSDVEVVTFKADEAETPEAPVARMNEESAKREEPVSTQTKTGTAAATPASDPKVSPVIYVGEPVEPKAEAPVAAKPQTSEDNPPAKSASAGVSNVPDMLLWFPNVFAPSSDNGEINRFRAQLNQEGATVKDFRMAIYNRAGSRVFFCSDINEAWDGTRDGQLLPQSAYVYVVFYTDGEGVQHHCKGTVTLVR